MRRSRRWCCRSTSGTRWSRRQATNWRMRRRPGMPSGTSSSRCRRSCATRACAASMPWASSHGGNGIVTPDGKPHLDDPQVKEAVIKALTYVTTAFKEGYVPPGALSWNDADDNNAFHAKQMIAYIDGTISPEVALYHKKEEYNDIV